MSMKSEPTLVFIDSAGHSGSTLLNMLLNGHSRVLGMSELSELDRFIRIPQTGDVSQFDSPFWKRVNKCFTKKMGVSLQRAKIGPIAKRGLKADKEWVKKNRCLIDCLGRVSESDFVVNAPKQSKQLYWWAQTGLRIKVIYLVRDGRAITNSYMKRYPNQSHRLLNTIKRMWMFVLWSWLTRIRFGKLEWLKLRYEDLAKAPNQELMKVCKFLGVNYEMNMLRFRDHAYYGVWGNPMRFKKTATIVEDNAWRRELSFRDQLVVTLTYGIINSVHGYSLLSNSR